MRLTYRNLKKILDETPEERLDDHIAVYDAADDECYEVVKTYRNNKDSRTADVLDPDHLVLFLLK